jgi:hypothetical protein
MKIVTGYRGTPHISANDQQAFNQGVIGGGNYVLDVGNHFEASLENVNTVQIRDGDGVIQGVHFRIEPGDFENVNIENGTTGFSRIDLVVARYSKDSTTGIESVDLVVIKGEDAASDPVEPAYNTGSILDGDSPVDFPLYRVTVNEITPSLSSMFGIWLPRPIKIAHVNYQAVTVNNGYCAIPYPDGFSSTDALIIQPLYLSGQPLGWTATLQKGTDSINVYVRQGTTTPANGIKITFDAIFVKYQEV